MAVKQAGTRGKAFTSDDVLPQLKDPTDGSPVPPYQGYLALAWLRYLGLIDQHGRRGGYTVIPGKQLDVSIESAWSALSDWRG